MTSMECMGQENVENEESLCIEPPYRLASGRTMDSVENPIEPEIELEPDQGLLQMEQPPLQIQNRKGDENYPEIEYAIMAINVNSILQMLSSIQNWFCMNGLTGGEKISNDQGGLDITEPITGDQQRNSGVWWKVRRCIVVGGLIQSITSLVIVTAAATANMSDGNIVALSCTSLIAGLFIVRHDVSRLQQRSQMNKRSSKIEVEGNRYKEILKDKMYYYLYVMIAFSTFLFFGLVPPLVYALSSLKTRNKYLKLITVEGASLPCTAFLAILKAHVVQKQRNWVVYVQTAAMYASVGVGAFGIAYLAGCLFGHLSEKLVWDVL